MIEIKDLTVEVEGKVVLNGLNLDIKPGEVRVLFGPNGSGKSTLIKAILGFDNYNITGGEIIFKGTAIKDLSTDERARLGIGVLFQHPPKIRGVKLRHLADLIAMDGADKERLAEALNVGYLLDRDINLNFSGGEVKRSELFQVLSQKPDMLLLDEPESGVDIENVALMGKTLDSFIRDNRISALVITHTGYILDYVKAKNASVMVDRNICCHGSPRKTFNVIRKYGYGKCRQCKCK